MSIRFLSVSSANFTLHPQLAADTIPIGDLPLCRVLLMNNRHFPWLILVPMREGLRELFDLSDADYPAVMEEVRDTAKKFAGLTNAHKMNIAALGNIVPQLHIHIIARHTHDAAWPNPVWNTSVKPEFYASNALSHMLKKVKECLALR